MCWGPRSRDSQELSAWDEEDMGKSLTTVPKASRGRSGSVRRSWGSRDLVGVGMGSMPPPPTSGLPFQLEQHDPCMISEEKEFCCCPHNPVKSENHWPNPIHLISHTMWKLRPGDRVSQHTPGRQLPPVPAS